MLAGLTGFHLLIIVAVIVMIFGATKLPVFAKSLGQSVKIMRGELQSMQEPDAKAEPIEDVAPVAKTEPVAVPVKTPAETTRPVR